ncbi:MAG: hypothetical protein IJ785_02425 [Bacteroidales bacterium]|nr:hypothetical protein [Bacteroidales bacterium]
MKAFPHAAVHCTTVLLLLLSLCSAHAAAQGKQSKDCLPQQGVVCESGHGTPQWKDIGLEDLLVVNNQPTVPTCRVVRPVHSLNLIGSHTVLSNGSTPPVNDANEQETRLTPGSYIYFLLRLRL